MCPENTLHAHLIKGHKKERIKSSREKQKKKSSMFLSSTRLAEWAIENIKRGWNSYVWERNRNVDAELGQERNRKRTSPYL